MRSKNFLGKKCVYASIRMGVAPAACLLCGGGVWLAGKRVLARRLGAVHRACLAGKARRDLLRERLRPQAARMARVAHHPDARLEALDRELALKREAVHE